MRYIPAILAAVISWSVHRASASVVVVTPVQSLLAAAGEYDRTFELQDVDFNGDGSPEFQVLPTPGGVSLFLSSPTRIFIVSSPPPNIGGTVANLADKLAVGGETGNESFRWYGGSMHFGHDVYPDILDNQVDLAITGTGGDVGFFNFMSGYFAVEFVLPTGIHYGWVRVSDSETFGIGGLITAWAYETQPGTPIAMGVPEPSILTLFVFGTTLMMNYRKRSGKPTASKWN